MLNQQKNHITALLEKASKTSIEESGVDVDKMIDDSIKLKDNVNKLVDDVSSLSHRKLSETNEDNDTDK